MGTAQQMGKFTPNLANVSQPLRDLLSSKNQWMWTEIHTTAFEKIKTLLASPQTLKLYDVNKPTKLRVDASKLNGMSVILYQSDKNEWHPVTCASRYLTSAEKNYFPIELEMQAVTWGCEKMNVYLQGLHHFTVQTDHKPLIPIINTKQLVDMSPRIQAMRMKQMKYSFTAEYVKGTDLQDADAFSRAPTEQPSTKDVLTEDDISAHVSAVITNMPASTNKIQQIKQQVTKDETLQLVINTMTQGWPPTRAECNQLVKPFWDSRFELTVVDGLLLKGSRIVIPKRMQTDMLNRIHTGHMGIERSKRRADRTYSGPI